MTDQMTLTDFIAKHQIRMTSVHTDRNPHTEDDDWSRTATHWRCIIRRGKARMTVYISLGSSLTGPPTLAEVLSSVSFASSFADNPSDFGKDEADEATKRQTAKLKAFLGPDAYAELLACERL